MLFVRKSVKHPLWHNLSQLHLRQLIYNMLLPMLGNSEAFHYKKIMSPAIFANNTLIKSAYCAAQGIPWGLC